MVARRSYPAARRRGHRDGARAGPALRLSRDRSPGAAAGGRMGLGHGIGSPRPGIFNGTDNVNSGGSTSASLERSTDARAGARVGRRRRSG